RARTDVAVMSRDDAGSNRAAQAERITDCEYPVTDAGVFLRELHIGELLRSLDLEERHVGTGVGANQSCREFVAVLKGNGDVLGILDDVVIADEIPFGRNEEDRVLREGRMRMRVAALTGLALTELLEEVVQRIVLGQVRQTRDG